MRIRARNKLGEVQARRWDHQDARVRALLPTEASAKPAAFLSRLPFWVAGNLRLQEMMGQMVAQRPNGRLYATDERYGPGPTSVWMP